MKKKNDKPDSAPYLPLTESCKKIVEEKRKEKLQETLDQIDIDEAKKAIRQAYWRNWAALPSVWVARDDDGSLWIYTTKPEKSCGIFTSSDGGYQIDGS